MMVDIFEIGTIQRFPLGMDYNHVVAAVHNLLRRCPAGTELVIDGTGIGKPVADMFKWRGLSPWCVTATAGIEQTIDRGKRVAHVPKLMLISRIQSLLFESRLKVQADIAEAPAFLEELRDFRVEYSAAGNMTYNARHGKHDDMVSAAAVAAWRLSDGAGGWGPPSEFLAAVAAGVRDKSGFRRSQPWVIGVDLGKMNDPTAVVVMRKSSVERLDPEAPAVETVPDLRTPWAIRRDELAARPTPHHPDVRGGPVEHLNGPNARTECAKGSLKWFEQQKQL
jgi:hypothetical protein